MADVEFKSDLGKLFDQLDRAQQDQVPFATAVTLKELATLGRDAAKAGTTFKNDHGRIQKGILAQSPSFSKLKEQFPYGETFVIVKGTPGLRAITPRQEYEKIRDTISGKALPIPGRIIQRKITSTGKVPKSKQFRTLRKKVTANSAQEAGALGGAKHHKGGKSKPKPFMTKLKKSGNTAMLVRRTRLSTNRRSDVLYTLVDKAKATANKLNLVNSVQKSVDKNYRKVFGKALAKALRTAK